jgi:hypothetical protein
MVLLGLWVRASIHNNCGVTLQQLVLSRRGGKRKFSDSIDWEVCPAVHQLSGLPEPTASSTGLLMWARKRGQEIVYFEGFVRSARMLRCGQGFKPT